MIIKRILRSLRFLLFNKNEPLNSPQRTQKAQKFQNMILSGFFVSSAVDKTGSSLFPVAGIHPSADGNHGSRGGAETRRGKNLRASAPPREFLNSFRHRNWRRTIKPNRLSHAKAQRHKGMNHNGAPSGAVRLRFAMNDCCYAEAIL
jgi:hypothetical protein